MTYDTDGFIVTINITPKKGGYLDMLSRGSSIASLLASVSLVAIAGRALVLPETHTKVATLGQTLSKTDNIKADKSSRYASRRAGPKYHAHMKYLRRIKKQRRRP